MEELYALGISCIEFVQYWFKDSEDYFERVNDLANPHYAFEIILPLVSVVDSVFAAQFLLCMAFGSWLNSILKWWLLEDRPYWWVEETDYYSPGSRPTLTQTRHTCETGPGSPSGHSTMMAAQLVLLLMWIAHFMNDRKCYVWWWKHIAYPLCAVALLSTMLARLYVATHFPHQVILGALCGVFLSPFLCLYVCDRAVWPESNADVAKRMWLHVALAVVAGGVSLGTYVALNMSGKDPMATVKLAYRWCAQPEHIHVSTTPLFALAQSTGSLLGWAVTVCPLIDRYRHYTKNRSIIIAATATAVLVYLTREFQDSIDKDRAWCYYTMQFVVYALKPVFFLRVVPWIAMWPYAKRQKVKIA